MEIIKTTLIKLVDIPKEKIKQEIENYLKQICIKSPATLSLLSMYNNEHLYFIVSQNIASVLLNAYDEGVQKNINAKTPPLLSFISSHSTSTGNNLYETKFTVKKEEIFLEVKAKDIGAEFFFYQIENAIESMKQTFKENFQIEFEKVLLETLKIKFDECLKYINDIFLIENSKTDSSPATNVNEEFLKKELCIVLGNNGFNSECAYLYAKTFKEVME
ncbi:hypothetical protein [Fusobacterium necrophorum]|jgi:hypothetical protein|uniref:Uncharacterized protein n=1 Tax=Fusobacterium necrophorum subsp. funduliforme TaxID=143387 RepID=A0A161QWA2_9FUSO|nr:hypothetical protein [Fusobacterium necrophorum]KYL05252.1 hypothetical protein A2J07_00525 [Fusobacterium necrophorum subsp. funduliforme]MDK4525118.1 hypothetical protein [Fusobacterium necrophorum]